MFGDIVISSDFDSGNLYKVIQHEMNANVIINFLLMYNIFVAFRSVYM